MVHHLFNNVLKPLGVVALALVLAHCHLGCYKPGTIPPELVYSGKIATCVNDAKTLEESHACRSKVNWAYGVCPSTDPTIPCEVGP